MSRARRGRGSLAAQAAAGWLVAGASAWTPGGVSPGSLVTGLTEVCLLESARRSGTSREEVLQNLTAESRGWTRPDDEILAAEKALLTDSGCVGISSADLSPARMQWVRLRGWLRAGPNQGLVSAVACVLGCCSLWNGHTFWRYFTMAVLAAFAMALARREAIYWGLAANLASELVLMLQAASATALAVHTGFEGSQVFSGAVGGMAVAALLSDWGGWLRFLFPDLPALWHGAGAVAGVLSLTIWRLRAMAIFVPLVGGAVVVSSGAALLARGCALFLEDRVPCLPSPDAPFVEAFGMLFGRGNFPLLPWYCLVSFSAGMLHRKTELRWPVLAAVCFAVVPLPLVASTCRLPSLRSEDGGPGCPGWATGGKDWVWVACGCAAWGALSTASVWRQLQLYPQWEAESFWKRLIAKWFAGDDLVDGPAPGALLDADGYHDRRALGLGSSERSGGEGAQEEPSLWEDIQEEAALAWRSVRRSAGAVGAMRLFCCSASKNAHRRRQRRDTSSPAPEPGGRRARRDDEEELE